MKNKASAVFKQVLDILSSVAKSKSMAIKNKTNAVKARLLMLSLMKNKKLMLGSVTDKIHGLLGHKNTEDGDNGSHRGQSRALVLYSDRDYSQCSYTQFTEDPVEQYNGDTKYPDLRHCLFDEEYEEFDDPGQSIIDLVKHSKEDHGEEFNLEDEIDHAADLFITRFHKQMRLQKLESFKRFQEMLQRSV